MSLSKRLINIGGGAGGGFDVSKLVQTQSRGTIAYGAVAVSPNGRWVLYGGYRYSPVWDDIIAVAELTTPYDLTTFIERSYSLVNGLPMTGRGAYINNDGNKIAYTSSDSIIRSFNLSSPGQVADYFYFGTGSANFGSAVDTIYFNNDGSKQFVTQYNVSLISEYNSSANPFRISTSNNYSYYLPSVSGNWNSMWGISFTNDGTKMLVNQATEKKIFQYTLAAPFDARTAVYDGIEFFHNITDAWYLTISEDDLSVFIGRDGAVYKFEF